MTSFRLCILLLASLIFSSSVLALNAVEKRNINLLANGGPVSIRDVSKSLYNTGESNEAVLDVLAEVLLQNYDKSGSRFTDALSWACKALGQSGNARYRSVLEEVEKNGGHKKLRKYADKSLSRLKDTNSKQYTKGSVSLAKLKTQRQQKPTATSNNSGKVQPISAIQVGMSKQETYALAGQPTAVTSHQTGKAFIPFNFKGGDLVRTIALYKGQGRIIFSNESRYSSNWKVHEVILNKDESGYP